MTGSGSGEAATHTYWLIGLDDKQRVVRIPLNSQVRIGRAADNDLVLNDARVSRRHTRIAPETEGFVVYDLNSVNGTFVNGVPVKRQPLKADDTIRFGPFPFRVERTRIGSGSDRSDRETPTMESLPAATRIVGAIDARGTGPRLVSEHHEDASYRLGSLYAFVQAISRTLEIGELFQLVAQNMREVFPSAGKVAIYLHEERQSDEPELRLSHSSGPGMPSAATLPVFITEAVVEAGRAILTTNTLLPSGSKNGGKSMYAPMTDRGQVLGVLQVSVDERFDDFKQQDLDMLSAIASMVAVVLQNARMHEDLLAQDRLQHDLRMAAEIQRSFLPNEVVSAGGFEFATEYRAAYSVGGDFYDVLWVAPGKLAVFIGDVSGKGVSAALLMARFSSELRVAAQAEIDPAEVLRIANRSVLARGQPELFYTAIYLTIDVESGDVLLANAGHPPPYICRASGAVERVDLGGTGAIGFFDQSEFPVTRLHLERGDSLVLYTDGIAEAVDPQGNLFGYERLEACLVQPDANPRMRCERILRDVENFVTSGFDHDDLTLLICHRGEEGGEGRSRRDSTLRTRLVDVEPQF